MFSVDRQGKYSREAKGKARERKIRGIKMYLGQASSSNNVNSWESQLDSYKIIQPENHPKTEKAQSTKNIGKEKVKNTKHGFIIERLHLYHYHLPLLSSEAKRALAKVTEQIHVKNI